MTVTIKSMELKKIQLGCISHLFPSLTYKTKLSSADIKALASYKQKIVDAFLQCAKIEQHFLYYSAPINTMNENSDDEQWKIETTPNAVRRITDSADFAFCGSNELGVWLAVVYGDMDDAESTNPQEGNIIFFFLAENYCDLK